MNFSLHSTEDQALAPAPASRDLPALQRPKRRRASVGKVLAAGLAALLALGGIAVVSVPGLSKPIRGLFKSTDLDIIPFEVKLVDAADHGQREGSPGELEEPGRAVPGRGVDDHHLDHG